MADSFVGIKIKDLPEAQQGNLTDNSVAVVDDGATTRKTKLSTFAEWLNSKLGIGKIKEDINSLNSTLKWSDWKTLGNNKLGIGLQYRYTAQEVELQYKGTLKELNISGGSAGYDFPALPKELNPLTNVEFPIYACAGNNMGKLTLRCFPTSTPNTFTITSHTTLTVTEEYICGRARYTRG